MTEDSISNFHDISTEFLKHYPMVIRQRASGTNLWKISHGPRKGLMKFMEKFKNVVFGVHIPDDTSQNTLDKF